MSSIPLVLCPIDLSGHSVLVVQHAGAVAEHFGARLLVVTVPLAGAPPDAALEALVHEALPHPAASRIECRVLPGDVAPAAAILQAAHVTGADLVVMGGQGMNGFVGRPLGSTIGAVLGATDIPTLVVPRLGSHLHSVRELGRLGAVLAPTDFSELSRRDVHIAAGAAAAIGVPLLLQHVLSEVRGFHDSEQRWELRHAMAWTALDALRRRLPSSNVELIVGCGTPGEEIARVAAQRHAGLLVMGLRGAGAARPEAGPGAVASRVLCLAPTLMLAIPTSLARHLGAGGVHAAVRRA